MKEQRERHIHYHRKIMPGNALFIFVIQYHYDCEVIVVTNVSIHPVVNGVLAHNICADNQGVSEAIYNDAISMLNEDGIC